MIKNILIKGADKSFADVLCNKKDYIKKLEKQLSDEEIYQGVCKNFVYLLESINATIAKIEDGVILKRIPCDFLS